MERDIWSGEKANVRTIARRIGRNAERVSRSAAPECRYFAGFTLLELMIVIAIIIILLGLAAGRYERSVLVAKEAKLKHDLQVMREAIEQYTLDKQAAPQSLEDLVDPQHPYLREIPTDPMTHAKDWQPKFEDVMLSPDQVSAGITDVHSNSNQTSPIDGSAYNTW